MDLLRLKTLRELSVRETMSAVADALCVSPSAVSQHISKLEEETDVQLLERRGRRVRLTYAGMRLASYAERAIAIMEEARAEVAELKGKVSGEVRIAAFSSVAAPLVPRMVSALTSAHPEVLVVLDELESSDGLAALRAWQADLALVDDLTIAASDIDANIEMVQLMRDELYVVLPKHHALATRRKVRMSELGEELWAMDMPARGYAAVVLKACRDAGFEPRVNAHCSNLEVLLAMVRAGCSISLLPGLSVASRKMPELAIKKTEPPMQRNIFVAFRRAERRRPAIAAAIEHLEQSASALKTTEMTPGSIDPVPRHGPRARARKAQ